MLRFLENHDEHRLNTTAFAAKNFWSTIPGMMITAALHDGPLMIYMGQEFGEKANEIEGYNEADDRSSMFDFWRVETHQRWMNGGKFDGGQLSAEEKQIDAFYQDLIKRVTKSEAISKGAFFDLQYAQTDTYPHQKVYSFIRYTPKERLLIVCNFDSHSEYQFNIQIPQLAVEMMGVKQINPQLVHAYLPPNMPEKAQVIGNKVIIPANSALIIQL
jgi:glycosidase